MCSPDQSTMTRLWVLLLILQVVMAAIQEEQEIDEYDTSKGGNGRVVVRREFPDRLTDLCDGIEDHQLSSGVMFYYIEIYNVI